MPAEPTMPDRIWVRHDSVLDQLEVSSVADPAGLAAIEPGWHEYATVAELAARDERVLDLEADVERLTARADRLQTKLALVAEAVGLGNESVDRDRSREKDGYLLPTVKAVVDRVAELEAELEARNQQEACADVDALGDSTGGETL